MTGFQIFYMFILPILIGGAGWAIVLLYERNLDRKSPPPGE